MGSDVKASSTVEAGRSDEIVLLEMTLAAVISVFDVDEFNSCLQELISDVVREL